MSFCVAGNLNPVHKKPLMIDLNFLYLIVIYMDFFLYQSGIKCKTSHSLAELDD